MMVFCKIVFIHLIVFFFLIIFFCAIPLFRFGLPFFLMYMSQDIFRFLYDNEDAYHDEVGERQLNPYDVYTSYLFEWEREYYAYYLEDQDDEGDGFELDDFEMTQAAWIFQVWYFLVKNLRSYYKHELVPKIISVFLHNRDYVYQKKKKK